MGIDESDIEKIADQLNKKRKPYRWYNDPDKIKKYAPIADGLCWIFGMGLVLTITILAVLSSNGITGIGDTQDHKFVNLAIQTIDCDSLKDLSLAMMKDDVGSPAFSTLRSNIDSQILARC